MPARRAVIGAMIAALVLLAAIAPAGAQMPGQFDGIYGGMTSLIRNDARIGGRAQLCDVNPARAEWRVADNVVLLKWQFDEWRVPIRPDGVISTATTIGIMPLSATGKITGNAMVLFFGSENCGYRFEGFRGG